MSRRATWNAPWPATTAASARPGIHATRVQSVEASLVRPVATLRRNASRRQFIDERKPTSDLVPRQPVVNESRRGSGGGRRCRLKSALLSASPERPDRTPRIRQASVHTLHPSQRGPLSEPVAQLDERPRARPRPRLPHAHRADCGHAHRSPSRVAWRRVAARNPTRWTRAAHQPARSRHELPMIGLPRSSVSTRLA